jgi:hypothetical protein
LGFQINISPLNFFLQMCRFKSSSFFHNTVTKKRGCKTKQHPDRLS